jgi:integrase
LSSIFRDDPETYCPSHVARPWEHAPDKLDKSTTIVRRSHTSHALVATAVLAPTLTLEKYSGAWLFRIKPTIAAKTHRTYGQMLRLYIVPILGGEQMLGLHEQLIGQFLTAWINYGLSANTVRIIRATLSAICADAVDDGHLVRNPVAAAGGRRMRRAERRRQRVEMANKQRVLTPAAYEAFLAEARKGGLTYHALFAFMGDQGPRPDEALSLPWCHVSLREGTAKIWATKTSSWRTVELTPRMNGLLRRLQTEQKRTALKDRNRSIPDLVFVNVRGKKIDQSRLNRRMKKALARAAVATVHSIYDLRHSFATNALYSGKPPAWVAEQMGDSIETVYRNYAHAIPGWKAADTERRTKSER